MLFFNVIYFVYKASSKSNFRLVMILFVWVNALFWGLTPLLGWSSIAYEPTKLSCTVNIMDPTLGYKTYIISSFLLCFVIPLFIMIYFQIRYHGDYELIAGERNSYKVYYLAQKNFHSVYSNI